MSNSDLHLFIKYAPDSKQVAFTLSDGTVLNKDSLGNALYGIFDNSYFNAELGNTVIPTSSPTLTVVESDVMNIIVGTIVLIDSVEYGVINNLPDGTGMSVLELEKL